MEIRDEYLYTDEHEWARREGDGVVTVGITDHAQDLLEDVVYVELPREGDEVEATYDFGVIKSVKTASDL
jgi:glycine cleavage system H protein